MPTVTMDAKTKIPTSATMTGCPVTALSVERVQRVCCFHTMLLYLHTQSERASLTATTWPAAFNRDARNGGSLINSFDVSEIIDITPGIAQVLPSFLSTFLLPFLLRFRSDVGQRVRCYSIHLKNCERVLRQL